MLHHVSRRSLLFAAALVLVAALTVSAAVVLTRPDPGVAAPVTPTTGPSAEPAGGPMEEPSATPEPEPEPSAHQGGAITIAFTGDVHGEKQIRQALERGEQPLAAVAPLLSAADLTVVNLETSVGVAATPSPLPSPDKQYRFLAPRSLLTALAEVGVDVVSLANNHSLDFGWGVLSRGLGLLEEAGLAVVGAGSDAAAAYAPAVFEIRGRTVAVVGLTRVIPEVAWGANPTRPGVATAYDHAAAAAAVRAAREVADHVVVTVHWGTERMDCPDDNQAALARVLREAGADAIVGHHPHVLQGVEQHGSQLTAYSLGNFLWYSTSALTRYSGVLTISLEPSGVSDWTFDPLVIENSGSPRPAGADEAAAARARLTKLHDRPHCVVSTPRPSPSPPPSTAPSTATTPTPETTSAPSATPEPSPTP